MDPSTLWAFVLLVFGFGFVVFFHELGHFLAAKWAKVKVEQFAVGFGQALFSFRKGIGVRFGSTRKEYEKRIHGYINDKYGKTETPSGRQLREAEEDLALGETEYRINWIPLGGYVKMLGQDDMKPNSEADDPRAYNRKSIGARMVIVSAGVVMNIILAAIGFMLIFRSGFHAPAPVVGAVMPLSPAQQAVDERGELSPVRVGDEILSLDGTRTHDYTKVALNTALLQADTKAALVVRRTDGTVETLYITPRRQTPNPKEFLMLGVGQETQLRGLKVEPKDFDRDKADQMMPDQVLAIDPGDTITAINGQPVVDPETAYPQFDAALQTSGGKPVELTVLSAKGATRQESVDPVYADVFGETPLNFLGMVPRSQVRMVVREDSPAMGKILPGDVILSLTGKDGVEQANLSVDQVMAILSKAGSDDAALTFKLLRGDQVVEAADITPNLRIGENKQGDRKYGLGIALDYDSGHAVVANAVEGSPAALAGVPVGAKITNVNGKPVSSWFDVNEVLKTIPAETPVDVAWIGQDDKPGEATLMTTPTTVAVAQGLRYTHMLLLQERLKIRQTNNLAQAAWWGVTETRDFVIQFYITIKRMFTGDISPRNMMGPLGIFHAGTKISERGYDWLIWFLSMISANLAVVNFLPIPIVDGGLFTFLVIEKIQGKPLSPRAQSVAQIVGLALLLGIFLLVTYQDISRLFQI